MRGQSLVIGLTGGIGTGKSAVLEIFRGMGAGTVSADEIVHRLSKRGGPIHKAIVREFGESYLDDRGELDRKALAEAVFRRPAMRRRLERATHPIVWRWLDRETARRRRPVVMADVPLLFETGAQDRFDATVLVAAPRELALRRIMRRDGVRRAQALSRLRAQWPIDAKRDLADVVITNDGSLKRLRRTVATCYRALELIARSHMH